jgi:hypothetical protein
MIIEDGTGKGVQAAVNREFKLATTSVIASPQQHASGLGRAYQVVSGVQSMTGAYGILALRNDSTDNMVITYIRAGIDQVETAQALVELYLGGTWAAGTATADPVNLNTRFAIEAGITSHYNSIPTGSPSAIDAVWLRGPDEQVWRKEGSIILPTNGIVSIKITPTTASVNGHGRISFIMLTDEQLESL